MEAEAALGVAVTALGAEEMALEAEVMALEVAVMGWVVVAMAWVAVGMAVAAVARAAVAGWVVVAMVRSSYSHHTLLCTDAYHTVQLWGTCCSKNHRDCRDLSTRQATRHSSAHRSMGGTVVGMVGRAAKVVVGSVVVEKGKAVAATVGGVVTGIPSGKMFGPIHFLQASSR
eukprot:6771434-Prymnesium_polylepis.1